jgi:hypothetical protein
VTAAALFTLLLLQAPGPATPSSGSAPTSVDGSGERIEVAVRFPPWMFTGAFKLTFGAVRDQGVARDHGSLLGPTPRVERVLEGQLGTLTLQLDTQLHGAFVPPIFGRWKVVGATGAYASLLGGGTFTAVGAGGGSGSPFERQVLLGRLRPRR